VNDGLKNLLSKTNRNGKMESIGNYSRFIEFTTSSIDFCRNRNKKKLDESDSIENDHCELCYSSEAKDINSYHLDNIQTFCEDIARRYSRSRLSLTNCC
jgi:hypothetical protein